jgi:hypothetical protein
MGSLSASERRGLCAACATGCVAFLAWAFPNMTRLFTIPGALGCFGFTLYFAWPEIRNALSWITRVLQGKKPTGVFSRRSLFSLGMAMEQPSRCFSLVASTTSALTKQLCKACTRKISRPPTNSALPDQFRFN